MYYEKEILPLNDKGDFLVAVHFPRHKIGGECTRESGHAYFAYGNIDSLGSLTDISAKSCIERAPNEAEKAQFLQISDVQKNMVGNHKTAWEYEYQAELATKTAQFVPRKVLTSINGTIVLGIECSNQVDTPYAVQRIMNVNSGSLDEHEEQQWPKGNALAYPLALSSDGSVCICLDFSNPTKPCLVEQGLSDRKMLTSYGQLSPMTTFVASKDHWIAIDDECLYKFKYGSSQEDTKFNIPKSVYAWTAQAAINCDLVVLSGDKGLVCTLNTSTGEITKYYPHRGCKRDDLAIARISGDGHWIATKIHGKSELVLTSLKSGKSWKVADIKDQSIVERQCGEYKSESLIPAAFGFISSRLLISESERVEELSIIEPEKDELVYISEQGKPGARVPLKLAPKATIDKLIKQAKLQRVSDQVTDLFYPACKLKSKKSKKSGWFMPDRKGAPNLGESRLGGWPDMPQDGSWPMWNERPMGFIGQINLAELAAVQPGIRLPKEGLLLFFLGCSEETYETEHFDKESYMLDIMLGSSAEHKSGWEVIYVKPNTILERKEFTGDILPDLFTPCLLKISKGGLTLPNEATAAYDCIDLDKDERENYNEVLDLISEEEPENQVSGYPYLLQFTPPELYCYLASRNHDPYTYPKEGTPEYKKLMEDSSEYGLLVQFTSDENADFLWGDAGHLYFYGKRREMEQGNFESCWVYYEN